MPEEQKIPTNAGENYLEGQTAIIEVQVDSPLEADEFNSSDFEFTLSRFAGDDPVIHKTDESPHVTVIDKENQIVEIKIAHHETWDLGRRDGADYYFELMTRTPTDDRAYLTYGTWTINAASTPLP